ncbi:antibiotic biosynthesis monooxygenase [Cellulosimicrobium funkei]|nr:antibiotic biosynthesis monooxygenase [Cellulosimicrobium funkei]
MIFIVVKNHVKPEYADTFLDSVAEFTAATRAEEGNLWFEWSRSVEDPNEFILIEAFNDGAGEAHVNSEHFAAGLEAMRPLLASTPQIISRQIEGEDWDEMGELQVG